MKITSITSLFSVFSHDSNADHCNASSSDMPSYLSFSGTDFHVTAAVFPSTVRTISLSTNERFRMTGKLVGNLGNIYIETMDGSPLYVMYPCRDYNVTCELVIHDMTNKIAYRVRKRQRPMNRFLKKSVVTVQDRWDHETEIFEMSRLTTSSGLRLKRLADGINVAKILKKKAAGPNSGTRPQKHATGTAEHFTSPLLTIMIASAFEILYK